MSHGGRADRGGDGIPISVPWRIAILVLVVLPVLYVVHGPRAPDLRPDGDGPADAEGERALAAIPPVLAALEAGEPADLAPLRAARDALVVRNAGARHLCGAKLVETTGIALGAARPWDAWARDPSPANARRLLLWSGSPAAAVAAPVRRIVSGEVSSGRPYRTRELEVAARELDACVRRHPGWLATADAAEAVHAGMAGRAAAAVRTSLGDAATAAALAEVAEARSCADAAGGRDACRQRFPWLP